MANQSFIQEAESGDVIENFDFDQFLGTSDDEEIKDGLCEPCTQLEKAFFRPAPTPAEEVEMGRVIPGEDHSFMKCARNFLHHDSFEYLESSATNGCELCKLLRDGILDTYIRRHLKDFKSLNDARDELLKEDSFFLESILKTPHFPQDLWGIGPYVLKLQGGRSPTDFPPVGMKRAKEWGFDSILIKRAVSTYDAGDILFMVGTQPTQEDLLMKRHQVLGTKPIESLPVGDPAFLEGNFYGREITREPNFQLAKVWIDECRELHTCELLDGSKVGPTRLIFVGSQEKLHPKPKLVECNGESYAYVCLSHRWSSLLECITSRENYEGHLEGLHWDSLPATFQDAIHTTLALGYNYLWIDALCIIQDDNKDWESVCPNMAAIYAGAQVTIAAPAAVNSESGFLGPRFAEQKAPSSTLRYRDKDGIVVGKVTVWYPAFNGDWRAPWTREQNSVLDTRGWVIQERMLSSRVLNFGSCQLYLECNSCTHYEVLQYPIFHQRDSELEDVEKGTLSHRDKEELFRWWLKIVGNFAERRLTFPMDKLPALSGIASFIHQATKGEYLAGLWRDDLARGLVWSNHQHHGNADRSLEDLVLPYRAPTWSWARSDCGSAVPMMDYHTDVRPQLCLEVLSANIELVGGDPFGQVKNACLEIRGKTRRGVIRRNDRRDRKSLDLFDPEPEGFSGTFGIKADSARFGEHLELLPYQQDDENALEDADDSALAPVPALRHKHENAANYELEVLTLLVSQYEDEYQVQTFGMVLIPDDEGLAYFRVGLMDTGGDLVRPGDFDAVREWFSFADETIIKIM